MADKMSLKSAVPKMPAKIKWSLPPNVGVKYTLQECSRNGLLVLKMSLSLFHLILPYTIGEPGE